VLKRHILKIFALILSIYFWFYVFSTSSFETTQKIKLIILPPKGMAIGNDVGDIIEVRLKGARSTIRSYSSGQNAAVIDLDDKIVDQESLEDTHEIPITVEDISVPFGLKVLDVVPKKISVKLERSIRKMVPVKIEYLGEIGENLRLLEQNVTPSKVMIEGPVETMRKIAWISISPIDLSQLDSDGEIAVKLDMFDKKVIIVDQGPFIYNYKVVPKGASVDLKDVPVRFLSSNWNFSPSRRSVDVSLIATDQDIFKRYRDKIQIIATIPENAKGELKVKLTSQLPEGIHLLQIRPQYINVVVR